MVDSLNRQGLVKVFWTQVEVMAFKWKKECIDISDVCETCVYRLWLYLNHKLWHFCKWYESIFYNELHDVATWLQKTWMVTPGKVPDKYCDFYTSVERCMSPNSSSTFSYWKGILPRVTWIIDMQVKQAK